MNNFEDWTETFEVVLVLFLPFILKKRRLLYEMLHTTDCRSVRGRTAFADWLPSRLGGIRTKPLW